MHLTAFIHQKSYEHIVHRVRRHPITIIPAFVVFFILLTIPFALHWLSMTLFPTFLDGPIVFPLAVLLAGVYYLSVILFFYSYFLDFYLDLLVVTNDRLIDIEQIGVFARSVSEVDLYQIQDITSEVKGIFASLFNYGNLFIQTAGATEKFNIHNVPNPEQLRREILDLAEEDRKYHHKATG